MTSSPFLPLPFGLDIESVVVNEEQLVVSIIARVPAGRCPLCLQEAVRVHSRYRRTVADLPSGGRRVVLALLMRKFFCDTAQCPRRIFTERLPDFIQPWARITDRFCRSLEAIGFATSGEAGSRLAPQVGMAVPPTTLLRRIIAHPIPAPQTISHLGIDDFAFRRGRKYGTLLVDLDSHRIVDLLPDRTTQSAASWLVAHPELEIISRDRGNDYASAARQAVPQAIQVADRFHLVKNLAEAVELALARGWAEIRRASPLAEGQSSVSSEEEEEATPAASQEWRPPVPMHRQQLQVARQAERMKRYEQVISLRSLGLRPKAIARRLGKSERTVRRWLALGIPEGKRRRRKHSHFDAYAPYVLRRWQEGCHNGLQLWREIQAQGYRHSARMVYQFLQPLRAGAIPVLPTIPTEHEQQVPKKQAPVPPASALETLSARQAVWLLIREFTALDQTEQETLATLRQSSQRVETLYQLAQDFVSMVRHRQGEKLDDWLRQAASSHLPDLKRFAVGIERDKAAVLAGLTYIYSNGVVEGQVHRVKLIKRMMYGRAGFALLRQRVLYVA
jgi:transposase